MSTKNTIDFTFAENTPVHEVVGYFVDETRQGKDAGILVHQVKKVKGLALFGPQGGVITEDDLTPSIVDFIMSKTEADGKTKTYEKFLVKKEGVKATKPAAKPAAAAAKMYFAEDGKTPLTGKALAAAKKADTTAATKKPAGEEGKKDDDDLM